MNTRIYTRSWTVQLLTTICVIALLFIGCHTTVLMYEGNKLPDDKVGIVFVESAYTGIEVVSVDGKSEPFEASFLTEGRHYKIYLLPGEHLMEVKIRNYGSGGVSLSFQVEAGHTYELRSDTENTTIGGYQQIELIPYILDTTQNIRVSKSLY